MPLSGFNFVFPEQATFLTGINDSGQIVGFQVDGQASGTRSFVANPVPELQSIVLVATGLLLIATLRLGHLCGRT